MPDSSPPRQDLFAANAPIHSSASSIQPPHSILSINQRDELPSSHSLLDSSPRPHETYPGNTPSHSSASWVDLTPSNQALTFSRPAKLPVTEQPANRLSASGTLGNGSSAAQSIRGNTFCQCFVMLLNCRSHFLHRRWA
jgi:hypothetical protein